MDYAQTLRNTLRDVMRQKGITQAWLAEKADVTEATISRYLTGVHSPKLEFAAKIAGAMGVSLDYLLGLSSSSVPNKPPSAEIRTLMAAYERADAHTKKMVWMQLDIYLTDEEKGLVLQQPSEKKTEAV